MKPKLDAERQFGSMTIREMMTWRFVVEGNNWMDLGSERREPCDWFLFNQWRLYFSHVIESNSGNFIFYGIIKAKHDPS